MSNLSPTPASSQPSSQPSSSKPSPPNPSTSTPKFKPRGSVFNARTITAPIAAFVMAGLLYTYSVTSIRAAKRNAQLHREADGGQLDMRRESLRRHGALDRVDGTKGFELFRGATGEASKESGYMGEKEARPLGTSGAGTEDEDVKIRTQVEGDLEGYKGRGNLERKMREGREGG